MCQVYVILAVLVGIPAAVAVYCLFPCRDPCVLKCKQWYVPVLPLWLKRSPPIDIPNLNMFPCLWAAHGCIGMMDGQLWSHALRSLQDVSVGSTV